MLGCGFGGGAGGGRTAAALMALADNLFKVTVVPLRVLFRLFTYDVLVASVAVVFVICSYREIVVAMDADGCF